MIWSCIEDWIELSNEHERNAISGSGVDFDISFSSRFQNLNSCDFEDTTYSTELEIELKLVSVDGFRACLKRDSLGRFISSSSEEINTDPSLMTLSCHGLSTYPIGRIGSLEPKQ
jgi:hypothetical protein